MSEASAQGAWAGGAPGQAEPDPRRWLILVVIAVAQLMIVLDLTVMNLALPSAQKALDFSNVDRQWVVTAYALSFGSLLLFCGRLADLIGRKRDVPYRPDRLRRGLRGRRRVGQLRDAGHRPRVPGRVRRDAGAGRAVAADHDVHRPEGAGQGLRRLRRHRRRGRGGRAAARRRADVVPVVALVPVHQPGLRRDRDHGRRTVAAQAAEDDGRQAGHTWRASRLQRGVLHRLRVLERCDARLEHTVHVRVPRRGGRAAGRLRRLAGARQPPAAAAPGGARPQPRRGLPGHPHRRGRPVRHLPVPDLLHAGQPGLFAGDQRPGLPADGGVRRRRRQRGQHRAAAADRPEADRRRGLPAADGRADLADQDRGARGLRGRHPRPAHDHRHRHGPLVLDRDQHRHVRGRPARRRASRRRR